MSALLEQGVLLATAPTIDLTKRAKTATARSPFVFTPQPGHDEIIDVRNHKDDIDLSARNLRNVRPVGHG